jgi:hypothetical protein
MLRKTHIDSLDGCPKWFHDSENQGIAKHKGQQHVEENCGIANLWMIPISLMNQNRTGENYDDSRD